MSRYFQPLAEFMGHMQVVEDAVTGTHLKHALVSLTGVVGEYERMSDLEGIMAQLAALQGKSAPRLSQAYEANADAIRNVLADTDNLNVREAVKEIVEAGPTENIAKGAKNLASDGMQILRDLWRRPLGKAGIIAGGAIVASELFGGLFRGDPEPVYPGGGAPMPPNSPMQGIAAGRHVDQNMLPPAQARINRPYHMRTHSVARSYAPAQPMTMRGGGYVTPLPSDNDLVYPDGYEPEATRWGMQNYMSRRMASSF
jgi:hypothetical protein